MSMRSGERPVSSDRDPDGVGTADARPRSYRGGAVLAMHLAAGGARMPVAIRTNHPYLRRVVDLAQEQCRGTTFVEPQGARHLLRLPRGSTYHLQWINVGLGSERWPTVLWRIAKLLGFLALLRARGTRLLWTCHNLPGKGHDRIRTERALQGAVALLADKVVILNEDARTAVLAETPSILRGALGRRLVHVPLPMFGLAHGPAVDRETARRALGMVVRAPDQPLVAYLPGTNQRNVLHRFGSDGLGFEVVTVDHFGSGGLRRTRHGWTFFGRPTDEQYGQLLCASDLVLLGDDRALGSMTLHTAVAYRRPVISPQCPAVAELARLGAAWAIEGPLTPTSVAAAIGRWRATSPAAINAGFVAFEAAHSDDVVGDLLAQLFEQR